MIRFTKYTRHAPVWLLHADVSVKFKEWCQQQKYHQALAELFFEDPEKFLSYLQDSNRVGEYKEPANDN